MTPRTIQRPCGAETMELPVRHFIRRDLPEILAIERASFAVPWTKQELIQALLSRNVGCMVTERDEEVVGYVVYERCGKSPKTGGQIIGGFAGYEIYERQGKPEYAIRTFAVREDWRRRGVGTELVGYLKWMVDQRDWRRGIMALVSEQNLGAQMFFREQGFVARLARRPFDRGDEDGHLFRWLREWE